MEALRVGGLASGLDTNSIIDNLMTSAKEPINRMNDKVELLTWEKTKYNDILASLGELKTALLPLKMESTFKSKIATSTKDNVAEGAAGVNTPQGSYTIKVDQTSEASYAVSRYTSYSFSKFGGGVTGFSGGTRNKYDQTEGSHDIAISNPSSGKWVATDTFTPKGGQKYNKMSAGAADSSIMGGTGKITQAINEDFKLLFSYGGEMKSMNIRMDYPVGTTSTTIAWELEQKINSAIDSNLSKDGAQHIAVKVDRDETTGAFNFAFYDTVGTPQIDVVGFFDPAYDPANPSATAGTPATVLAEKLGINLTGSPLATDKVTNVIISDTPANLATRINDPKGSLLQGSKLKIDAAGLKVGNFVINQDATANNRAASKSTFTGDKFSKIPTLNPATRDAEIDAWMKSSLRATDSDKDGKPYTRNFFDTMPSTRTNGYFHINGVRIDIYDYTSYTPERLIGLINGSGAGVTASFDRDEGKFKIESNTPGSGDVTMGQDGDTSDILSLMKVTIPSGATYTRGKNEGTVDTSAILASSDTGLSSTVSSGLFTINGVSIYVDTATDSLQDVMKKVNKSGAKVTLSYDTTTDKFSMRGEGIDKIKLGGPNDSSNFLEAIGLTYNGSQELATGSEGKKAIFTINGTKYERGSNQVNDAVEGMTINISDVGTTTINVKIDTDKAVDAMAGFASKYNKLMNMLSPVEPSRTDREKYSNPLSDTDKKDMSEDDIKSYQSNYDRIQYYDTVSRSSELRYLKMNTRENIMKEVVIPDNQFGSLSSLGLDMAGTNPTNIQISKMGFLLDVSMEKDDLVKYIKEQTKFSSTVANNADDVYKFFNENKEVKISKSTGQVITDPTSKEAFTKITYSGWAKRYDTFIVNNTSTTSALYKKAGTNGSLDTKISSLKTQIETQTKRAESYLERMWAQFSAMEQRVQSIQSQASYLTQLSSGSAK